MDGILKPATASPWSGIAPNLIPTPPAAMPEPPEAGDAMAALSPFQKPQDVDQIIKQLSLDRPLPLYIPNRHRYKNHQFHIINSTSKELAEATRRGWQPADIPELVEQFEGKVSGVDTTGKITKPVLVARDRRIGEHEDRMKRKKLQEQYAGLDPTKRQFNSKYADAVSPRNSGETKGQFSGAFWRIRV